MQKTNHAKTNAAFTCIVDHPSRARTPGAKKDLDQLAAAKVDGPFSHVFVKLLRQSSSQRNFARSTWSSFFSQLTMLSHRNHNTNNTSICDSLVCDRRKKNHKRGATTTTQPDNKEAPYPHAVAKKLGGGDHVVEIVPALDSIDFKKNANAGLSSRDQTARKPHPAQAASNRDSAQEQDYAVWQHRRRRFPGT